MGGPEPLGPRPERRRHRKRGAQPAAEPAAKPPRRIGSRITDHLRRAARPVGANVQPTTGISLGSGAKGAVGDDRLRALTGVEPAAGRAPRGAVGTGDDRVRAKLQRQVHARTGEQLTTLPGVQSLSLATRYLPGGRSHFIELVQLAALDHTPDAVQFLAVLASLLPSERQRVSYDDVCAAAGIRPSRLVGVVTSAAMEYGADVGNLVYAASHPKVVAAGVAAALKTDGTKDREMLFQHQGFIPVPKSTMVTVNAHASAEARAAAVSQATPGVPSFAEDLASLGPPRAVRQLEAAVEAEAVEFDEVPVPVAVAK